MGLIVGWWYEPILIAASGGLALLMLLGVATRIRIRDSIWMTLPAALLMVVNGGLCVHAASS